MPLTDLTLQIGDYLVSMLSSNDPSISFQAAQSLMQLTRILSSQPNSGGVRAVAGVASSWGPLAVAALLQLWDRQLSVAGHAQLMEVLTHHLDCFQVLSALPGAHTNMRTVVFACSMVCTFVWALLQTCPCRYNVAKPSEIYSFAP